MALNTGNRHVQQFRPKGQADAPYYSPHRDLAYVYAPALREAFQSLDHVHWQEYFKGWLEAANITEDHLGAGVKCFCDAHALFVSDPTITSPADAFQRAGFFDLPAPVRIMLFERLGEVISGGFFVALRDVTPIGQEPPKLCGLHDIIAGGATITQILHGDTKWPRPDDVTYVESELAVVRNALRRQTELTKEVEKIATEMAAQSTALLAELRDTEEKRRYVVQELSRVQHTLQAPLKAGWFVRLLLCYRIFFKRSFK